MSRYDAGRHSSSISGPRFQQQLHALALLEALEGVCPARQGIDVADQRRGAHAAVRQEAERSAPGRGNGGVAAGNAHLLHADLIEIPCHWLAEEADLRVL